ncbi:hypothetical protein PIROE2DRAFT_2323 [Piromyces sp. E2]|nr:hypothetical protein PIROE2DRAFT_2323 [Piromyces sp. E2]|eukprot:OUM69692.1 hypothetical protein PIROE2DRAFT_2323 [Piromyces sp. E2]
MKQNQGQRNNNNVGNVSQIKTSNKFINLSNTFEKLNDNFIETKYTHASTINKFHNQYSNFINSFDNKEYSQLTSPRKDWNSKNLLSSYAQPHLKYTKNGYSEKLVNIITKKRSNFHIWLHSIQKAESTDDIFKDTIIVEVKQASVLNSIIEMKCNLVTSYQKNFSNLYYKEGGNRFLEIIVLTNINRSWPSQNNIGNVKIKKLLKEIKEKKKNKEETPDSVHFEKPMNQGGGTKEINQNDDKITLCEKTIQNGTLLIIKEPKTILHHSSTLSKDFKKSLIIYNDLFLIFNV